ncbi:hypothetical protein [Plantactinospora veratri]
MSASERAQAEAFEAQRGWAAMNALVEMVNRGNRPRPIRPTIMTRPGESQFAALTVDVSIFHGMDVEYTTGGYGFHGGLLFVAAGMAVGAASDARKRRRAEEQARPQWRFMGRAPAVVTDQRLLVMIDNKWNSLHLGSLVSIHPDLRSWALVMQFEGAPPLMLRGPWVPWLTVLISAVMFGQPFPPGCQPPMAGRPQVQGPPQQHRAVAPSQAPAALPPGSTDRQ